MNTRCCYAGASALLMSLLLTACSNLNELMGRSDSVDYKSARPGTPLTIPPDLTQAADDPRYRSPDGSASFSEYQQHAGADQPAVQGAGVLPQRADMRVERDGNIRWLSVDRPPEVVFPKLVDFWIEQGFTLRTNNPRAGLLETDWAENRAKIPESWIRSALGMVFDNVWDSGERERFRTRVERVDENRTEIFVSHEQMLEKNLGSNQEQVQWVHGQEDPGLNAAMLARMLVYLGTDTDRARTMVAQAEQSRQQPRVEEIVLDGSVELRIDEPFDRAWRRVGLALDAGGFAVDDRDRSAGDFYVRYLDTDTGEKRAQPNIFTRLFGSGNPTQAAQYRVHLERNAMQTLVTVLDEKGQRDASATARRMLTVLSRQM